MRIEVLVGSEDPIIFPLKSSKIVIGSGEGCDVTLDASGISRKHLTVVTEGDQYFVIDQGSTNGSFINEERLVPGRRVEFTSFFPVRLGDNVLVSLLSDEEDINYNIPVPKEKTSPSVLQPRERDDSTTVLRLNDLKKVRTESLVLERNQKRDLRKKSVSAAPTKPIKKPNYVAYVCIFILAVAAYYNFFVYEPPKEEPIREVGKILAPTPNKNEVPVENIDLIPEKELPKKEAYAELKNNIKCAIDVEIYLCQTIPGAQAEPWGVAQIGLSLNTWIDGNAYIEEAKDYFNPPADGDYSNPKYQDLLRQTAAYLFLMKSLPLLDEKIVGENKLFIGLYVNSDSGPILHTLIAIRPHVFNKSKELLIPAQLGILRSAESAALEFTKNIYTVY